MQIIVFYQPDVFLTIRRLLSTTTSVFSHLNLKISYIMVASKILVQQPSNYIYKKKKRSYVNETKCTVKRRNS